MIQVTRILAMAMLVVAVATMGYAQSGAITPGQMKMMSEHMQMMAERMKDGQMTPDQMKTMSEHMKMMNEHMKGDMKGMKGMKQ